MRLRSLFAALALCLGAAMSNAAPEADLERTLANPPATGLLVIQVLPGSQAAAAGLRVGDVLVSYGGAATPTPQVLTELTRMKATEARVEIRYVRADEEETASVRGGRLGVGIVPLEKGKPIRRDPETPYEPNLAVLKSGESFYNFVAGGRKVGFERHLLTVEKGTLSMDHLVRFKFGDYDEDMRMRLKLLPGRYLTVQAMEFHAGGSLFVDLKREGEALVGKVDDKPVRRVLPLDAIPSWSAHLVALTMPRKVGACLHFTMVNEGEAELVSQYELVCAAREKISVAGKEVEAYRYEARRFGSATNRWWIAADRLVRADFSGPIGELTDKADALKNLPPGVSDKL